MNRTIALLVASAACATWAKPLEIVTEQYAPFNYQEGKEIKGSSTEAVRALLAKAGVEGHFTLLKWNDAYQRAQKNANTCIYSTSRVENREKLFKWYGPIARDVWALYALPTFNKPVATVKDARFFKIGAVHNDAKVDYLRAEGASSIREADHDSDNPARLTKPKTAPDAIDLWITAQATAKDMAAAAGVKDLKEVLVVRKEDLYLACNPRTDKAALEKLEAASK